MTKITEYAKNGAKVICDQANLPVPPAKPPTYTIITSNKTIKGQSEPLANQKDTSVGANIPLFGTCKQLNNGACTPIFNRDWDMVKNKVKIKGENALLISSELKCNVGSGGKITFSKKEE
ncbi:PAAR-like protein [Tenacibaculum agarivorans]|uniref:PAAR-like protein n=1 Tax=Tenacibaculum agarivorans TaxID=1908389 RepID=UPI00094BBF2C|nr:PAAR-like protein [Tenacibaculum agarivorans]